MTRAKPVIRTPIPPSETLHTRIVGMVTAWLRENGGYAITGVEQFDYMEPHKGAALIHLSYGYAVAAVDAMDSNVLHVRKHDDAYREFFALRASMRSGYATG